MEKITSQKQQQQRNKQIWKYEAKRVENSHDDKADKDEKKNLLNKQSKRRIKERKKETE